MGPRTIRSESGEYQLVVDSIPPPDQGACLARLMRSDQEVGTVIWQRHLINNRGPLRIMVTDSGKYVVTFGDWGWNETGDVHFEMVIYGPSGQVVQAFPRYAETPSWLPEPAYPSVVFFDASETVCVLRGAVPQTHVVALASGEVLENGPMRPAVASELRRQALLGLESGCPSRRGVAALICGQEGYTETRPKLKKMLSEDVRIHGGRGITTVAEAARAALSALDRAPQGRKEKIENSPNATD